MELVLIALGAVAVTVLASRRSARPHAATPVDPYTSWMMANLPSLRSWRR